MVLSAVFLMALAAPQPAPPRASVASAQASIRIVHAASVRDGRTDQPHQRRRAISPEGRTFTLLEFE